jgi:hypothetical protein
MMNESQQFGLNQTGQHLPEAGELRQRVIGSPLPVGGSNRAPLASPRDENHVHGPQQPGRGLTTTPQAATDLGVSLQRVFSAVCSAFPFLQKVMQGNESTLANTVSNMLTPHPPTSNPNSALDLAPIENNLAELRAHHRDLRNQIVEQSTTLKRVESQLDLVREATDRNTLEQQELIEDLKTVSGKVYTFSILVLLLLIGSVVLNIFLYLHISRVLP